jgi:hypothetical protein
MPKLLARMVQKAIHKTCNDIAEDPSRLDCKSSEDMGHKGLKVKRDFQLLQSCFSDSHINLNFPSSPVVAFRI